MKPPEPDYHAYLLRLWRPSEGQPWRAMLEHIGSHERHGFANLESLCAFLQAQAGRGAPSPSPPAEAQGEMP